MQGTFTWKNDDSDQEHSEQLDQRPRSEIDNPGWDQHTPEQRAHALLDFYNNTLRPHEKARRFVRVDEIEEDNDDELDHCPDTLAILQAGMMPDLDFFVPNENFKAWLSTCVHLRYHPVLDIGAGSGLMTKTLQDEGFACTGLDIMRRPEPHTMIQVVQDETIVQLVKDCTENTSIFIARPCHSGFAERFFKLHLKFCNRLFAYYIGLEKNVELDLPDMSYEIVARDVGESGEHVYQVYGTKSDCRNLYKLATWAGVYELDDEMNEFVSVDEGNIPAGIRRDGDQEVLTSYIGMRYTFQRPRLIDELETTQDCGWIDPNGRFYRVPYTRHSEFIYQFLFMDEARDMEGWVKVWPPGANDNDLRWYREGDDFEPTPKQLRVMKKEFGVIHKRGYQDGPVLPTRSSGKY